MEPNKLPKLTKLVSVPRKCVPSLQRWEEERRSGGVTDGKKMVMWDAVLSGEGGGGERRS